MTKLTTLGDISIDASKEAITSPAHLTFSQRQPKAKSGGPTLILTSDLYTTSSSANITLRVIGGRDVKKYALSQVKITQDDGDILNSVEFGPTGRDREYTTTIKVGLKGHVALVAYPSSKEEAAAEITRQQYRSLDVCSNPIVIVSVKPTSDDRAEVDKRISSSVDNIVQSLLSPTSGATGSSSDFYKIRGIVPSDTRYPDAEHQNARRTLQGTTENLSSRIAGVSDFIHANHLIKEVPALSASIPTELADKYIPYTESITEGSSSITSSIESSQFNPSRGNTVTHNVGNQDITSSQYSLKASTILDLNAPTFIRSSQVDVTDTKDRHVRSFLSQSSSVHSWSRAEKDMTRISGLMTDYSLEAKVDISKASSDISSDKYLYADSMLLQVGLSPPVGIALDVASAKEGGASVEEVEALIKEADDAIKELNIIVQDAIKSYTVKGDYSISAGVDFIVYANASVYIRSNVVASLDSSITFINCRVIKPPPVAPLPRINKPFVPIEAYPRTDLPKEGSVYNLGTEDRIPTQQGGPVQ